MSFFTCVFHTCVALYRRVCTFGLHATADHPSHGGAPQNCLVPCNFVPVVPTRYCVSLHGATDHDNASCQITRLCAIIAQIRVYIIFLFVYGDPKYPKYRLGYALSNFLYSTRSSSPKRPREPPRRDGERRGAVILLFPLLLLLLLLVFFSLLFRFFHVVISLTLTST